jgi:HK97 family phage portal protein
MEEFGQLLGASTGLSTQTRAGVTMTARRALGITAWYSGVRYLSETVASLPVHTFRDAGGMRVRRADPPWVVSPDAEQCWYGFVEFTMMALLHKGNAYAYKLRGPSGAVEGLREIHPDRVTVGVGPDNTKRFMVQDGGRTLGPFTTREILHIPGLAYDGRVGLNPIQVCADALGTVAAADDYAGRFFGSGTHVGGLISVSQELSPEQAQRMRVEWDAFHDGLVNAHKTGVLSKGATYSPLALNAEDAQLIESRQWGVAEVARVLRIPPHKLYELSRATFSNIEHQSIEAVVDGIRPWVERIEAWVNFDRDLLPEGNFEEFQIEGLLRGDTASRFGAYSSAIGRPWMVPNEARRLENLEPLDGGDDLMNPLNMAAPAEGDAA